jgi:hypothetical protein
MIKIPRLSVFSKAMAIDNSIRYQAVGLGSPSGISPEKPTVQ